MIVVSVAITSMVMVVRFSGIGVGLLGNVMVVPSVCAIIVDEFMVQ